ncbi:DUF106 domain-containing protein [Candidatus Woesearchaeota archaeon]|nr:DUF106 domain-containing protein [Candidatus Woesearchaeota archaeon]
MGIFNFLDTVLNFLLGPIARIDAFLGLAIITLIISLIIIFIYKAATNQERMKELREKLKKFQEDMKKSKKNPEKMMAKQKEMMEINMEMMKHSFKSTLYTFIPVIILFGWMASNFSFYPALPGEEITTTVFLDKSITGNIQLLVSDGVELLSESNQTIADGKASWKIKADKEGTYNLVYELNSEYVQNEFVVSKEKLQVHGTKKKKMLFDFIYSSSKDPIPANSLVREIKTDYRAIHPLGVIGLNLSWIWSYIILSIIFSMVLRKMLKVY